MKDYPKHKYSIGQTVNTKAGKRYVSRLRGWIFDYEKKAWIPQYVLIPLTKDGKPNKTILKSSRLYPYVMDETLIIE